MRPGLIIVLVLLAVALGLWWTLGESGSEPTLPGPASQGDAADEPAEGPVLQGFGAQPAVAPRTSSGRFTIRGTVLDADKQPLPGVRVALQRTVQDRPGSGYAATLAFNVVRIRDRARALRAGENDILEPAGELVSGDNGRFVFRLDEGGWYHLYARVAPPLAGGYASAHLSDQVKEHVDVTVWVLPGAPVHGRVEDARGEPVSAHVGVRRGRWRGAAHSGPDGAFRFTAVPAGKAAFTVTLRTGRQITGFEVKLPSQAPVVLRLPGGTATLSGTVRAPDGTGVPGAAIVLYLSQPAEDEATGESPSIELAGESDASGHFAFEGLPAAEIRRITAAASGFLAESQYAGQDGRAAVAFAAGEATTIDVALRRGSTVQGTVRGRSDGTHLEGATVTLLRTGGVPPPQVLQTTDTAGRYRFEGIDAGSFIVLASHPTHFNPEIEGAIAGGFGTGTRKPPQALAIRLRKEDESVRRDLVLVPGRRVAGTVVDPDGANIVGARVYAKRHGLGTAGYSWGMMMSADVPPVATSGADGSFAVDGLAPRADWVFFARQEGFAAAECEPVDLMDASEARVTLRLVPQCVLKGRVLDEKGLPLPDQSITISGMTTLRGGDWRFTSGADGAFELHSLPAARLEISTGRGGESVEMRITDLEPGEVRTGLVLRYGGKGEISGRVTDSHGDPVRGITLLVSHLTPVERQGWLMASSGAEGRFRIQNVPAGRVRLSLYRHAIGRGQFLTEPFDAPAADVAVTYDPPRKITISGVVVGPDGLSVPVCSLRVHSSGSTSTASKQVTDGTFKIAAEGDPPYSLTVTNPRAADGTPLNIQAMTMQIADVTESIRVRLTAGRSVSGRVLDLAGKGVAGVHVQTASGGDTRTDGDGAWRILGLPDELVGLTFQPPAVYRVPEGVVVEPGSTGIETRLEKGADLRGRVITPGGAKLLGGTVTANWARQGAVASGSKSASFHASDTFLLQGLPPEIRVVLDVEPYQDPSHSPRLAPTRLENIAVDGQDVEVRLLVGVAVSGIVVHADGSPRVGGSVSLQGDTRGRGWSAIDAEGAFRVEGLRPGTYALRVTDEQGRVLTQPQEVTAPSAGVRVVLPDMGRISGRLVGAEDPSAWGVLAVDPETGESAAGDASAGVAADGTWTIGPMTSGRSWVVIAREKRGASSSYARSEPVKVGDGNVRLTLERGETISGRTERDGRALPRCWVIVQGPGWHAGTLSDKQGKFTLSGLPAGRYRLEAQEWSLQVKCVLEGVRSGARDVVLGLK